MQLRTQTSVNAEELFVHDGRQRQRTKRFDASFIDALVIFVLAFQFESKIIRQMATFMISPQQPKHTAKLD
jgi:hypothetical protein